MVMMEDGAIVYCGQFFLYYQWRLARTRSEFIFLSLCLFASMNMNCVSPFQKTAALIIYFLPVPSEWKWKRKSLIWGQHPCSMGNQRQKKGVSLSLAQPGLGYTGSSLSETLACDCEIGFWTWSFCYARITHTCRRPPFHRRRTSFPIIFKGDPQRWRMINKLIADAISQL